MNSLNHTHILPQQTTQGSQAPQQPLFSCSNDNSKIPSNSELPMSQFWKDDCDWNKNWETPLLDTYRDGEAAPEPFPLEVLPADIQGAIEEVEKMALLQIEI
jgi:putative DNA primase/helicase